MRFFFFSEETKIETDLAWGCGIDEDGDLSGGLMDGEGLGYVTSLSRSNQNHYLNNNQQ